ncbi:MAG: UUP1 family membrane protein [Myxococcales bacterium]|nr:UUP1 family membrane protein [Myxococcales bacterium]
MQRRRPNPALVIALLLVIAGVLGLRRLQALDYDVSALVPDKVWDVDVGLSLTGHGDAVRVATYIPTSDDRQTVVEASSRAGELELQTVDREGGRLAEWQGASVSGPQQLSYRYRVATRAVEYVIDPEIRLGDARGGDGDARWLTATEDVQVDAADIAALAARLVPDDGAVQGFLRAAFDHVQAFGFQPFKGTTDALTALRLGEASCNGRSRLLVALARNRGLPARLVGGLILEAGSKRTSHQWVEIRVGGHWVPFDALNHHFASLPANYLTLYRGDQALFTHSRDIGFKYNFRIDSDLVPRAELQGSGKAVGLWATFAAIGVPLELLTLIIMIPLGATVVTLFRNVLGLRIFGTFLPALVASACHHTGYWWGMVGFVGLIVLISLTRRALGRLELLHSPQLAVLLTAVVGGMLAMSWAGVELELRDLARVTLFPVAIMAITSERFTLMEVEDGAWKAWTTLARTVMVIGCCYVTMQSLSLQILMLGFPELLLVIVAIDIWLGRWMGLRLMEWLRFRGLIHAGEAAS